MIVGVISSLLFSFVLGILLPISQFGVDLNEISSLNKLIVNTMGSIVIYILYSIPIILFYGTITSYLSDSIAKFLSRFTTEKLNLFYSAVFHILFGLLPFYSKVFTSVLTYYSLWTSIIFFVIDLFIRKLKKVFSITHVLTCWGILIIILFIYILYVIILF